MISVRRGRRRLVLSSLVVLVLSSLATPVAAAPVPGGYWAAEERVSATGRYVPLVGDFNGDGLDDVFWYAPGASPEHLWLGRQLGAGAPFLDVRAPQVTGTYRPIVGNFDGDRSDDIFWYGPGRSPDRLWILRRGSTVRIQADRVARVDGVYEPHVITDGGPDGPGAEADVMVWYDPDGGWVRFVDYSRGAPTTLLMAAPHDAQPVFGDLDVNGMEDVFWYRPGTALEYVTWRHPIAGFSKLERFAQVRGRYEVVAGRFISGEGGDQLVFHHPQSPSSVIWDVGRDRVVTSRDIEGALGSITVIRPRFGAGFDEILFHDGKPMSQPRKDHVLSLAEDGPGTLRETGNSLIGPPSRNLLVGSFTGGAHDDVLRYVPGPGADRIWISSRWPGF